jgi:hypothetical protein
MKEKDRTAMTEPLTTGQKIVAWWETSTSASEPADLADRIDGEIEPLRAALREIVEDNIDWWVTKRAKEALGECVSGSLSKANALLRTRQSCILPSTLKTTKTSGWRSSTTVMSCVMQGMMSGRLG